MSFSPSYVYSIIKNVLLAIGKNNELMKSWSQKLALCHCVESVLIRSYSGPHFSAFGLNTQKYSISLRIQSECGKMRTRITPTTDTFHALCSSVECLQDSFCSSSPVDTGRKLNVYKTFRRRSGRLLNILSTFNLRPVSTGLWPKYNKQCFQHDQRSTCQKPAITYLVSTQRGI